MGEKCVFEVLLVAASRGGHGFGMKHGNMEPMPVRFSRELMDRVDGIAKSMALSHSAVLRVAINQWFEAGGDKNGQFDANKKIAKKAAPKGRGKRGK